MAGKKKQIEIGSKCFLLDIFSVQKITGQKGYFCRHEEALTYCLDYLITGAEIWNGGSGLLNGKKTFGLVQPTDITSDGRFTVTAGVFIFKPLDEIKIGEIWQSDYFHEREKPGQIRVVGLFNSRRNAEKELVKSGWLDKIIESQKGVVDRLRAETVAEFKRHVELLSIYEKYGKNKTSKQ